MSGRQAAVPGRAPELVRIAGVDEVGRGPLAGPVVAAAVVLPFGCLLPGLRDSKQMTAAARARLDVQIRRLALDFAIAEASVEEIDALNILQASFLAMQRAVSALRQRPAELLVDGNLLPQLDWGGQHVAARAIVGGDDTVLAISAASVLAKEYRDRLMVAASVLHPDYGFAQHKGYGTPAHLQVLQRLGVTPLHRLSFAPVRRAAHMAAVRDGHAAQPVQAPRSGSGGGLDMGEDLGGGVQL